LTTSLEQRWWGPINETPGVRTHPPAASWAELHGAAYARWLWWRLPDTGRHGKSAPSSIRHRLLPRERARFEHACGDRRVSTQKTRFVAGLLRASHLVPLSLRPSKPLLCSRARSTDSSLSGLAGNAALPTVF